MCNQTPDVGKHSNSWKYNCPLLPYPLTGPFLQLLISLKVQHCIIHLFYSYIHSTVFTMILAAHHLTKNEKEVLFWRPPFTFCRGQLESADRQTQLWSCIVTFPCSNLTTLWSSKAFGKPSKHEQWGRNGWQGETDNGTIPQCERSFLFNSQALLTFMELLPQQLPCSKI